MNRNIVISALLLCFASLPATAHKKTENLKHWMFSHNNKHWLNVDIPHDWAISEPFDKKWDLQTVAIEQNGETQATEKSGRSGALPWIGKGFYRTSFISDDSKYYELVFDGAMSEPVVYVNGVEAGRWAYGYNAFRLDISRLVNPAGEQNIISVALVNLEESSRWYPGAGIFRPVTLIRTSGPSIDTWGIDFRTLSLDGKGRAELSLDVDLCKAEHHKGLSLSVDLADANGRVVAHQESKAGEFEANNFSSRRSFRMTIGDAHLWSPETPYLYNLSLTLKDNNSGEVLDIQHKKVGVRTVAISAEKGFQLNGQTRKFKGVCLHHDLGPLGAAVNKAALVRQIKMMKEMGADAIRTAHNMPSTMQMDICDSLGMMVMAESTDTWKDRKVRNGYNRFFDKWIEKDITNLILNHRNHPSIVMWSIGNEIPEQWKSEGADRAEMLVNLCHKLDPTRPVTAGCDKPEGGVKSGFLATLDVPGLNYRVHKYQQTYSALPQGFLLGSETASTVSSRGEYFFSVEPKAMAVHDNGQSSGYDNEYCSWSNLPDDDWAVQDDNSWTIGEFVWTGYDYLGEPTPYDEYWPSRSSYFGICDLAGLPKDRYYLYRSRWNTVDHTIHLVPHWTWPSSMKDKTIPVECYTDFPSAELFVNGKSQGVARKDPSQRMRRYRLIWDNVVYQPGELSVVCYDADGNVGGRQTVKTAGKTRSLHLEADKTAFDSDDDDIIFVTVSAVDRNGIVVPDDSTRVYVGVTGGGDFKALCNGDATSLEQFTEPTMKLFHGQLVVLVKKNPDDNRPAVLTVISEDKKFKSRIALKR